MKCWIGIDPGAKGALCALFDDGTTEVLDFNDKIYPMLGWLNEKQLSHDVRMVMIEDVHSIFGTSAKSNFNFGFNTGIMHGIVRGTNLALDMVKPKEWQKHVGVKEKGKKIKKEVAAIASRLYPGAELYGPQGGLKDGRSDALMVASYCKFKHP